jgi:hypothetical protein
VSLSEFRDIGDHYLAMAGASAVRIERRWVVVRTERRAAAVRTNGGRR